MVKAFVKNEKAKGSSSPSGGDIFCLKNVDPFTRTSVRVSKMNAVARARLTSQMLTFLRKYLSAGQIYMRMCFHLHIKSA